MKNKDKNHDEEKQIIPYPRLRHTPGGCEYDKQKVIVVNKIPRGAYAGEEMPEGYNFGWYEIGLSRNGKEPIEYIWRAAGEPHSYGIMNSEIGDSGVLYLSEQAKQNKIKLPLPNAKKPPTIGTLGDVYLVTQKVSVTQMVTQKVSVTQKSWCR